MSAFDRILALSREDNVAKEKAVDLTPVACETAVDSDSDSSAHESILDTEGVLVPERELSERADTYRTKLLRHLTEYDFGDAEEMRTASEEFFGEYITGCTEQAKACARARRFEQARHMEKGAQVGRIQIGRVRGKKDPRLTERMELLLEDSAQERSSLQVAMRHATDSGNFGAAKEANDLLKAVNSRYRSRLVAAYRSALSSMSFGTRSIAPLRKVWEKVDVDLPEGTPPRPIRKKSRARRVPLKLTKDQVEELNNRLCRPKKAITQETGEKYLLQDELNNCVFEPDVETARTAFLPPEGSNQRHWVVPTGPIRKGLGDADPEMMKHKKEGKMLAAVQRTVLPSVGVKMDVKTKDEDIGKLLASKTQIQYWGLTEVEILQVTMAPDKLAKLHSVIRIKEFVARNCVR